jgi:diacylglycerol kinase (ATP)
MPTDTAGPIARLVRATLFSLNGLQSAIRTEPALRLELLILILLFPGAFVLTSEAVERALLIGSWMLVIVIEVVNSAIETIVDRIGFERHELSGRAKDLGSAAVFCAIALATVVWILVLTG